MKRVAHIYKDHSSPIFSVKEARELNEKHPEKHPAFYDLLNLRPVFPVIRQNGSSSFSFHQTNEKLPGLKGGKGLVHELVRAMR